MLCPALTPTESLGCLALSTSQEASKTQTRVALSWTTIEPQVQSHFVIFDLEDRVVTSILGCEIDAQGQPFNCYPFNWKTVPEYYEDAGVTWQVYQDTDNYVDDPLVFFQLFQNLASNTGLYNRGVAFNSNNTLDAFFADAAAGTLPLVSYIVGPGELSEHQPNRPIDGGWLQKQIVEAVVNGKGYNNTVLMISYDGKVYFSRTGNGALTLLFRNRWLG